MKLKEVLFTSRIFRLSRWTNIELWRRDKRLINLIRFYHTFKNQVKLPMSTRQLLSRNRKLLWRTRKEHMYMTGKISTVRDLWPGDEVMTIKSWARAIRKWFRVRMELGLRESKRYFKSGRKDQAQLGINCRRRKSKRMLRILLAYHHKAESIRINQILQKPWIFHFRSRLWQNENSVSKMITNRKIWQLEFRRSIYSRPRE